MQAQVAELFPEVRREEVVVVDRSGTRRDLVGGEAADGVAQHLDGFTKVEAQDRKVFHAYLLSQ